MHMIIPVLIYLALACLWSSKTEVLPILGLYIPSVFPSVTVTLIIKECKLAHNDKNIIYSKDRSFSPITKLSCFFGLRVKELQF